jgi:hypothetical protein
LDLAAFGFICIKIESGGIQNDVLRPGIKEKSARLAIHLADDEGQVLVHLDGKDKLAGKMIAGHGRIVFRDFLNLDLCGGKTKSGLRLSQARFKC